MAASGPLLGLLGGAAALAAGGIAAGLRLERALVGRRVRPAELDAGEAPFFSLSAPGPEVITPDGVRLHVEVEPPPQAVGRRRSVPPTIVPPTIVFVHGYVLSLHCWHYQRLHARGLAAELGARIVCYDQRSHGRSTRSAAQFCRIPQLAEDLAQVLEATTEPDSPLILVGHSMGGMTIMDLIRARPGWFGDGDHDGRVRGVALIATAADDLHDVSLFPGVPGPVFSRVAPPLLAGLTRMPELVERTRRVGSDLASLTVQQYAFGRRDVPAALVDFMASMVAETSFAVVADFYPAFAELDEIARLRRLARVPTLVIGGRQDKVLPAAHTERILAALPSATGRVIERCGHMDILEWHEEINADLEALYRAALAQG